MTAGLLTPLQLIAGSSLLNNQGIKSLPSRLTTAISNFNDTSVITAFLNALIFYQSQTWATSETLLNLQSIGNSTCPALGDSIPSSVTNLTPVLNPGGFSGLVTQTGNAYLGGGDAGKFCQGFNSVQGFIKTTNMFINSAVNAQTYLGPTFAGMDALTTNNISNINSNFDGFGSDLFKQGQLFNLAQIDLFGTPAGLLQQLSKVARIPNGTLKIVELPLISAGLAVADIKTLISGRNTLTEIQFNQLQKIAYIGMTRVTGADLEQVLAIMNVTIPNIQTMADLLDPKKIFPTSYSTLATTTPNGPELIYQPDGSVNMNLASTVNLYLPSASGCEELGKIVPPDQAVAIKAVQVSLQQITGITLSNLPALAQVVRGTPPRAWNVKFSYLANDLVAYGSPIAIAYRAQKNVPAGIDINNTEYWLPTSLGGLSTMAGLPAIQSQTSVLPASVISEYIAMATGTGPNGTINVCDVIGLAIDYNNFASLFESATAAIQSMPSSADLTNLIVAYQDMLGAGNNTSMQTYINNANTAIQNIANHSLHPEYTSYVETLNSAFSSMAGILSKQQTYLTHAGIDYFNIQSNDKSVIYSFVMSLPGYGTQVEPCGAAYFLNQVADTSVIGGQAIVGTMREGTNNQRFGATQLGVNTTPSLSPSVTPSPVVVPIF